MQRPPEALATGGGPNPHEGDGRGAGTAGPSLPKLGICRRDASGRLAADLHPLASAVCPVERAGEQRATCCSSAELMQIGQQVDET